MASGYPSGHFLSREVNSKSEPRDVHIVVCNPNVVAFIWTVTAFIPPCTCILLHFRVPLKIPVTLSEYCRYITVSEEKRIQFLRKGKESKAKWRAVAIVYFQSDFFDNLTEHLPPLRQEMQPLSVPYKFLISENETYRSLSSLELSRAVDPAGNIPTCKNRPKSPIRGKAQKIKIALLLQSGRL